MAYVSILISTKNRKEILKQTLDCLFYRQSFPKDMFEVVVTNDGADYIEDLNAIYPFDNLLIVPNKRKPGLAGGRNNGVAHAKGDYLFFLDDDILVNDQYLQRMLSVCTAHPDAVVCANRFYPDSIIQEAQKTPFGRYKLKFEYNWVEGMNTNPIGDYLFETNGLAGFSASMKRSVYETAGVFNETFDYAGCEDSEFFYRARKAGFKLLFDESNICYHNEMDNFTLKAWLRRQSTGIRSAVVMCVLHPEGKLHPTWFTNTPISENDTKQTRKLKRKKAFLSGKYVATLLFFLVRVCETIRMPDKILFRCYNALWLGMTFRSFKEAYRQFVVANHD